MDAKTMAAACASTQRFVDHTTEAQYGLATPCDAWDVRSLLNHLLGTLALGEALLSDSAPPMAMEPGGLPDTDLVGDDPVKAFRAGVEALLSTADDDALTAMHTTPFGDMPGATLGGFTTVDILVHGWDLATATGQDPALDEDLAAYALAFAHETLTEDSRAPRIGPAVDIDPAASITDQLVGFFGRTP
jgi:uncharacterized protein (TIGR03086 family)